MPHPQAISVYMDMLLINTHRLSEEVDGIWQGDQLVGVQNQLLQLAASAWNI